MNITKKELNLIWGAINSQLVAIDATIETVRNSRMNSSSLRIQAYDLRQLERKVIKAIGGGKKR